MPTFASRDASHTIFTSTASLSELSTTTVARFAWPLSCPRAVGDAVLGEEKTKRCRQERQVLGLEYSVAAGGRASARARV